MKRARFSKVVQRCREPETYLLLMEPAKDRTYQAGVKAQPVMTVVKKAVGKKTDRGEVGFSPTVDASFLSSRSERKTRKEKVEPSPKHSVIAFKHPLESEDEDDETMKSPSCKGRCDGR